MKKLTSLLCFAALGLFAVGCEETGTVVDDAPAPDVTGEVESGSGEGGAMTVPEDEMAPPTINEEPPALTPPPAPSEPTPETPAEPAPTEPAPETPAPEEPAEPAAEAEAEAETPAPAEEPAPEEPAAEEPAPAE